MSTYHRRNTRSSSAVEEVMLLNIHLHIKHNVKRTLFPSADIPLHSRPLLHPLLTNVRLDLHFDKLLSILNDSDFLSSDSVTKKYGQTVSFDERMGLTGWKALRNEEENPRSKLRGKAAVEIDNDNMWKEHVIDYAGINPNGVRCIDIGISLFAEERNAPKRKKNTSFSSSSGDESQSLQKKRKSPKKEKNGFRAPKEIKVHILSPVEHYNADGRDKVKSTITLGTVDIDFEMYILEAYDSGDDVEILADMSSISMESSISTTPVLEKKKKSDDDELERHIFESIRHILAYNILENMSGRFNMYKNKIGKKSALYMTTKKTLSPDRIDNTRELVSFIKEAAKKSANWKNKTTMEFRVAFGARRDNDTVCTAKDFRPTGILLPAEEVFSQELKDQPIDYFQGSVASHGTKSRAVEIERFLDSLYNDEKSQLYHGFSNEMKLIIRNCFMTDKEFYNNAIGFVTEENSIPMEENAFQRLMSYITTAKQFTDLHPEKHKFPPHDPRKPPTLTQWKRTETGRGYANSIQNNKGKNANGSIFSELFMSKLGDGHS